ncbi:hypothetical protein AWZ03_009469 [Drosophila navojoa]|uniref:Uncharacterized protein n=1 Tax=Drosophila navojoa TaxID=7232 RepID=A0A484B619_DRONA|nr:putative uncharacterized protein DDB_G0289009 [Drosophila navojoa]XP_030242536.1 putative uncharacterized protein DDB_G0289009 [Drosophila navojoa]TDG44138.1 hypothetical protein AWZ03_009469 [Drosophila navojoa]
MALQSRLGAGRGGRVMSYTNYALLMATVLLVLISAHVKSAKLHEEPQLSNVAIDKAERDNNNNNNKNNNDDSNNNNNNEFVKEHVKDAAAIHPYHQHVHGQHKPHLHHVSQLNNRRAYHSKYSIEQLLHMHVTPKVSNDIDMDPCKAGE